MNTLQPTRRDPLKGAAVLAGISPGGPLEEVRARAGRDRIGACEWSIGIRARTGAMAVGRELGLQGVQMSMEAPLVCVFGRNVAAVATFSEPLRPPGHFHA